MVKIVAGVVVIVILAGGLFYLNKLEQDERNATQQMRFAMEQARANAPK